MTGSGTLAVRSSLTRCGDDDRLLLLFVDVFADVDVELVVFVFVFGSDESAVIVGFGEMVSFSGWIFWLLFGFI